MITETIIALKDFLLDKNPYFDRAFANVYLDELTGLIYQGDSFEKFAVGIDDRFGNYFYIRTDPTIDYSDARPPLSDSSRAVDQTMRCYLVAVVVNAKPKELVQSLLNTLLKYGEERIRTIRAVHHREAAVAKELAKIPKEDLQHVLQQLGTRQVVIIEFVITVAFIAKAFDCIPSPCKNEFNV